MLPYLPGCGSNIVVLGYMPPGDINPGEQSPGGMYPRTRHLTLYNGHGKHCGQTEITHKTIAKWKTSIAKTIS